MASSSSASSSGSARPLRSAAAAASSSTTTTGELASSSSDGGSDDSSSVPFLNDEQLAMALNEKPLLEYASIDYKEAYGKIMEMKEKIEKMVCHNGIQLNAHFFMIFLMNMNEKK